MLARNFLTPTELNISDKQFNALVQVLGMLERGELPWHKSEGCLIHGFNMREWGNFNCKTVGCLGFWYEKFLNNRYNYTTSELSNLFFTNEINDDNSCWAQIGPEQAAHALQNYLTTGKADWAGVLA